MSEPLPDPLTCSLAVTRYARAARMIHHHNAHVVVAILRTVAMAETHHTHPDPTTRAIHHHAHHPNRYRSTPMTDFRFNAGDRVVYAPDPTLTPQHGVVVPQSRVPGASLVFVRFDGDPASKVCRVDMLTPETT